MKANGFRLVGQVVGIDADAMAADQSGPKRLKIPLGACGLEDLAGLEPKLLEQHHNFVDQGDVDVALDVLDDLGRFATRIDEAE